MDVDEVIRQRRAQGYPLQHIEAERLALIWSGITGHEIKPEHVGLMLVGLKLCRESFAHNEDNITDAHGYLKYHQDVIKNK